VGTESSANEGSEHNGDEGVRSSDGDEPKGYSSCHDVGDNGVNRMASSSENCGVTRLDSNKGVSLLLKSEFV
jgi:hypothetical protein